MCWAVQKWFLQSRNHSSKAEQQTFNPSWLTFLFRRSMWYISVYGLQVRAGDTSVLETVLRCDTERSALLEEEVSLLRLLNPSGAAASPAESGTNSTSPPAHSDPDASVKLERASPCIWIHQCLSASCDDLSTQYLPWHLEPPSQVCHLHLPRCGKQSWGPCSQTKVVTPMQLYAKISNFWDKYSHVFVGLCTAEGHWCRSSRAACSCYISWSVFYTRNAGIVRFSYCV